MFRVLLVLALTLCGLGSTAFAIDDSIFLPNTENPRGIPEGGVAGPIRVTGYKKVPPHEALNAVSIDLQVAGLESRGSLNGASEFKNLYLAFAFDVRFARECSASKVSSLCTFYHAGAQLSGNASWTDLKSTDRYEIVLVPLEFVMGVFGRAAGTDLKNTEGALYVAVGGRSEFLRDLGLQVQNRILNALSVSANYTSQSNPVSETMGFRWIGSVRLFGGCSYISSDSLGVCNAVAGGLETQVGLALDLEAGAVALTNTSRLEGDIGVGSADLLLGMNTNKVEFKYLRGVCRSESEGGCKAPRLFSYGGGLRYEYATSSFEQARGMPSQDQSVHRIMLFGELARF